MQQHLMQMHPMMAAYYPSNVTTDHIQQGWVFDCLYCLASWKNCHLFLVSGRKQIADSKIVESQNSGKLSECAENQARLQRNLMYLAAIADSHPQQPTMHSQYSGGGMLQPSAHYLQQHQQAQQMTQQSLMSARSSLLYGQQQYSSHQQQALHNQLGMSSAGSSGLMLQGDPHTTGGLGVGFPDFSRGFGSDNLLATGRALAIGSKQEIGSHLSAEGRGGDGGETLYMKGSDDGN